MKQVTKGFTLIELLVTIGVIGVLAASLLVVLNPLTQFQKTRDAQRRSDFEQLQRALEVYYNDNNKYPCWSVASCGLAAQGWALTSGLSGIGLTTSYITQVPNDPTYGAVCPGYLYASYNNGQNYTLFTKLEYLSDPTIIIAKTAPAVPIGACSPSSSNCQSYTISSGTCASTQYTYWVNNP